MTRPGGQCCVLSFGAEQRIGKSPAREVHPPPGPCWSFISRWTLSSKTTLGQFAETPIERARIRCLSQTPFKAQKKGLHRCVRWSLERDTTGSVQGGHVTGPPDCAHWQETQNNATNQVQERVKAMKKQKGFHRKMYRQINEWTITWTHKSS